MMETYEDDDDTHFCIKCHVTVNGLENYVRHRQSGCRPPEAKQEVVHEPPTTPTTVTYPEILNADAFFSSLELQSSAKSNPTPRTRSLTDKERKTGKSDDKKKKIRRGHEPDDGGGKEKLLNMPPVVTDLDDLMDNLAIPSLVGFPEIVTTTGSKSSAVGSGKSACVTSSSKVNNDDNLQDSPLESLMTNSKGSSDRKRNPDSQRIDPDHGEWLEDTILADLDANSENKEGDNVQLTGYAEYDYRQDEESDEDSLEEEIGDEESYTDDDYPDDREFPDHRHTGGKWKPSELLQDISRLNDDELDQDDDNQEHPPVTHTGGKWKPADSSQLQRVDPEDDVEGTDPGTSSLTPSATSRQQPPPGHTRGKWIPGAAGDLGSGYWCDPCGRKLASRLLYNRHLLSDLHARRSIQEIDGDLQLPSGVGPLLQRKSASKRQRALAEIKSVPKPEEIKETTNKKKTRKREKEVLWCEMCHARVRRPQMGKHLLSHYHCRVAGANPCNSPTARRFILENMGNVVRQCPFQCGSCRFYCNTEETFLLHWRSKLHATRFEDKGVNYKCTPCNFWCIENEKMEHHLQSSGHREVVAMMNGSVPVVVRRQRSLVCETCNQHFRYNLQLRFHVRETGHRGSLTATDEYQSKIACNLCSKVFRSLVALQRHQLSCHGHEKDEEAKVIIQPSAPYFCSFCTLNFTTSKEAVLHRRTTRHKEIVKAQKLSAENIGSLGRECPYCDVKQGGLLEHKEHLLERHPELCHRCPQCGMLFALPQDVTRHTKSVVCTRTIAENEDKVTSDDEEWRCSTCPFITSSQAEFMFHEALHAGSIDASPGEPGSSKTPAKYQCPMCEKSFPKNSLRNHIRSHTGERPFCCIKCSASFSRRSGLNAHRKECVTSTMSSLPWPKGSQCLRQRNHTCSECNTAFYTNRLASRLVSYQETYTKRRIFWRRRATRINYRWQTYLEAFVMYECCDGYTPPAAIKQFKTIAEAVCSPFCPSGCTNGKCITPNTCDCDSGYRATAQRNACIPHCKGDGPNGCGADGSCSAPNKCICDNGYTFTVRRVNGTTTSSIPCIPECKTGCGKNAFCQSPNNCACNFFYTKIKSENLTGGNFDCEPSCLPKCGENMNCFAPNKCQCNTGYFSGSPDSNITDNSERPEYCSPVCNPPCLNGICTNPNYCTCNPGYKKTSTGWQHECSPICNPPCVNASCTKPNYCECDTGYRKNVENPYVCLPHCDPPCINGTCTKPGYCECNNGYEKNLTSLSQICSPVCDPPCVNATCTEPNHCECYNGYEKEVNGHPQVCYPSCTPGCKPNAFCFAPNKCLCNPGYVIANLELFLDGTSEPFETTDISTSNLKEISCEPVCEPACNENESCVSPNTCQCYPGYQPEYVEGNLTQCLPICEPSCVNGYCGQPNKCICLPDYEPSHEDGFCNPVCQNNCFNATCTRPNYCECYDGYEKAFTSTQPINLQEVYENTCVPSCPEQCLNGTCIAPGQCLCDPGYILRSTLLLLTTSTETTTNYDENNSSTIIINETVVQFCQPLCEPACPIGSECLSPNECEPQSDDSQDFNGILINSTHGINSIEDCGRNVDYLDENGKCVCKHGWKGWKCERPSLCGLVIRDSFTGDEEFTTLQSTTVMINDTMETTYDDSSDMRMISSDEDSGVLIDWEGPMCKDACRIMTSSEISGNRSDDAVKCYLLESENLATGVFSIRNQVLLPGSRNGTFICFISIDSMCNVPDSEIVGGQVNSLLAIIIGMTMLLVLVSMVGIATYRRKSKGVLDNPNHSMNNTTMLINSESIPLCDTEESTSI